MDTDEHDRAQAPRIIRFAALRRLADFSAPIGILACLLRLVFAQRARAASLLASGEPTTITADSPNQRANDIQGHLSSTTLDLLACLGHLAVALLVLQRMSQSPIALPMGLLALNLFAWNFASFAFKQSGRAEWHWLDLSISPLSQPLALQVLLTFLGKSRRHRPLLVCTYVTFATLALGGVLAFVWPAARTWIDSPSWAAAFLSAELASTVFCLGLLVVHYRRTSGDERTRTLALVLAVVVGMAAATTEFWDDVGFPMPALANIGTLFSTSLVAMLTLRFRFLDAPVPLRGALVAFLVGALGLGGYLGILRFLQQEQALLLVASVTLTAALVAAGRHVLIRHAANRARLDGLTTLGRFSLQMAHDLRNPLAALKGSVQFLDEEVKRGRSISGQESLLSLLAEEVARLERVIDRYQRLARMQPERVAVDLNDLVRDTCRLKEHAVPGLRIDQHLATPMPSCALDRDLLMVALDNLFANALDAVGPRGVVSVATEVEGPADRPTALSIRLEDNGQGMDARSQERAFDEFFTTKNTGSGLGLPFVKRVIEVHGGRVSLQSALGRGTVVNIRLPFFV